MRKRNPELSRQTILAAAEVEFAEKGFFGARVDEIADSAQINKRMIYAYFGDKEGLYKQVLFHVYARMEKEEQRLVTEKYKGAELIRQIIATYFRFLQENPSFVHILMWENLNRGRYLKELESDRISRSTIRYFVDSLEEGKMAGVFRKDVDAWHTVLSLITVCFANFSNQYTLSKLFGKDLSDPKLLAQREQYTVDMMIAYLCEKNEEA